MPELPEVETIKRDLSRLIVGRKILGLSTDSPKQVKPSFEVVKKAAVGASIDKIERRAKLLQFFLANGETAPVNGKSTCAGRTYNFLTGSISTPNILVNRS